MGFHIQRGANGHICMRETLKDVERSCRERDLHTLARKNVFRDGGSGIIRIPEPRHCLRGEMRARPVSAEGKTKSRSARARTCGHASPLTGGGSAGGWVTVRRPCPERIARGSYGVPSRRAALLDAAQSCLHVEALSQTDPPPPPPPPPPPRPPLPPVRPSQSLPCFYN